MVAAGGHGDAADVHDFAVLEWPPGSGAPLRRPDARAPTTCKDPTTGKPIVLYDVREPYRDAFEAWTGINVGLPMAIVLDWVGTGPRRSSTRALRDNVQITLGSGPLVGARGRGPGAHAHARRRGRGPVRHARRRVHVASGGRARSARCPWRNASTRRWSWTRAARQTAEQARVPSATFRRVPGIEADAADAVDARLAEIALGALEVEAAAPLLRGDVDAAVEQLARVASGDVSNVRRRAAATLLGLLDPKSETAIRTLVDPDRRRRS